MISPLKKVLISLASCVCCSIIALFSYAFASELTVEVSKTRTVETEKLAQLAQATPPAEPDVPEMAMPDAALDAMLEDMGDEEVSEEEGALEPALEETEEGDALDELLLEEGEEAEEPPVTEETSGEEEEVAADAVDDLDALLAEDSEVAEELPDADAEEVEEIDPLEEEGLTLQQEENDNPSLAEEATSVTQDAQSGYKVLYEKLKAFLQEGQSEGQSKEVVQEDSIEEVLEEVAEVNEESSETVEEEVNTDTDDVLADLDVTPETAETEPEDLLAGALEDVVVDDGLEEVIAPDVVTEKVEEKTEVALEDEVNAILSDVEEATTEEEPKAVEYSKPETEIKEVVSEESEESVVEEVKEVESEVVEDEAVESEVAEVIEEAIEESVVEEVEDSLPQTARKLTEQAERQENLLIKPAEKHSIERTRELFKDTSKDTEIIEEELSEAERGLVEEKESLRDKVDIKISQRKKKDRPLNIDRELGLAYQAIVSGQTEAAINVYKQILEIKHDHKTALFGLATAYHRGNQLQQAREIYLEILQIYPNHQEAMNNFMLLIAKEEPYKALYELQKIEKTNAAYSPVLAQIAMVYLQMENLKKAKLYLARAINITPDNASYLYNYAVVLDRLGEKKQATVFYQRVLEKVDSGAVIAGSVEKVTRRLQYLKSQSN